MNSSYGGTAVTSARQPKSGPYSGDTQPGSIHDRGLDVHLVVKICSQYHNSKSVKWML